MPSPENYNQMLSKLGKLTFLTTLIFLVALRFFGVIPKIEVDDALIPPVKDYEELIEWCLSFGAIPLAGAGLAWLLSTLFEVHNKLSKFFLVRFIWDKYFIVKPMLERAEVDDHLTRSRVKQIMAELYYPEVKNIDQHYVHIFWRYALQFWVLFEHLLVVTVTVLVLGISKFELPSKGLLVYLFMVLSVASLHWFFVVTQKSKDQADQISEQAIRLYMRG
ncbi:hypothetical protein SAMN04488073_0008 [Marinobacter gudaonensis]|uniref:Uncharacterized protein n=1 Tax=Marinobacter gudaonensis TaxID=375760 RepID=A0A1I6G5T0_9GAMM|nr:hypothetical protein [Marinobacter gudaonensis]SFR37387.1 hypothetical protein SAMN04488073_0008 [Marinobacter gudaonensis]